MNAYVLVMVRTSWVIVLLPTTVTMGCVYVPVQLITYGSCLVEVPSALSDSLVTVDNVEEDDATTLANVVVTVFVFK